MDFKKMEYLTSKYNQAYIGFHQCARVFLEDEIYFTEKDIFRMLFMKQEQDEEK